MSKQYNDSLTSEQVDAITHAWLDLCASKEHFEGEDQFISSPRLSQAQAELAVATKDSVKELEKEFPFLTEPVDE